MEADELGEEEQTDCDADCRADLAGAADVERVERAPGDEVRPACERCAVDEGEAAVPVRRVRPRRGGAYGRGVR